jgi:hypothetical protein
MDFNEELKNLVEKAGPISAEVDKTLGALEKNLMLTLMDNGGEYWYRGKIDCFFRVYLNLDDLRVHVEGWYRHRNSGASSKITTKTNDFGIDMLLPDYLKEYLHSVYEWNLTGCVDRERAGHSMIVKAVEEVDAIIGPLKDDLGHLITFFPERFIGKNIRLFGFGFYEEYMIRQFVITDIRCSKKSGNLFIAYKAKDESLNKIPGQKTPVSYQRKSIRRNNFRPLEFIKNLEEYWDNP